MRQAPASIISAKDESALKRKSEQDSDGMSSKNQRVDDFEEVPMDSDESGTCDLIVLGLSWKVCYFYKGQLISECLLGVIFQKTNEEPKKWSNQQSKNTLL